MVKKAALTLGALVFGGTALIAPAAHADSSASVPGAKATFTSSPAAFRVYDTACDGNSVYLVYRIGGRERRLDLSIGCDESVSLGLLIAKGTRIDYKVCVSIKAVPDECSVWTTDRT